jgi:hypothetical protein
MAVVDKMLVVLAVAYLWEWTLELIQRDLIVSLVELYDVQVQSLSYMLKAME